MKKTSNTVKLGLAMAIAMPLLWGCAATSVAISKRTLDVQSQMSDTIFLDPVAPAKQVILLQLRNTSDKPDFVIKTQVEQALIAKGWRVTTDPDKAQYMMQVNILQVGKMDYSAAQSAMGNGYGGAIIGGAIGYGVGKASGASGNNMTGTVAGAALVGAGVEFLANAIVKDVYFGAITDVQLSQRTGTAVKLKGKQVQAQGNSGSEMLDYEESTNWKRYRTRVLSTANKVNLKWEEAEPVVLKGLTNSISGLF